MRAQQLLEASLLAELQTVVTRALSGMDMFSGTQLEQVLGHEPALPASQVVEAGQVRGSLQQILMAFVMMAAHPFLFTPRKVRLYRQFSVTQGARRPLDLAYSAAMS